MADSIVKRKTVRNSYAESRNFSYSVFMKESLVLSERGQITLPASMRRALGLRGNALLTAEQVGGRIVLTPAVVVETELFSEPQIAEWDRADQFVEGERERLLEKLKRKKKRA